MTKRKRPSKQRKDEPPFEPQLYQKGLKLFEMRFDYAYDIGVPSAHPIDVRLLKQKEYKVGSVQIERKNGSITIDEARTSFKSKSLTQSSKRISRKAPIVSIDLEGTQPLHYRVHKFSKIVAPVYRSKVTVKFYSDATTMGNAVKQGRKFFNQYLKAYRVASGDPVPYVHEDKKDLHVTTLKYAAIDGELEEKLQDVEQAHKHLSKIKPKSDGGMSAGIGTSDFDMSPKPYHQKVVFQTVEYGLLPEHIPVYNEPIIEAIELAHRKNEYGLGIVMLNAAFEGAIAYWLIACLALLDYDEDATRKFYREHKDLEQMRKVFDDKREEVLTKYGLKKMKRFRGSAEEQRWDKTTYKKRHVVVHVTDAKTDEITKADFEDALAATQKAIVLLSVPIEEIKKLHKKSK